MDFPSDNIPEHKEIIFLSNRYSQGNYLEQTCPNSPWYELKYYGNYLTINGEDPIVAVDPEGGPCIIAGSILAGYRVMEIRQVAADDRIIINLEKKSARKWKYMTKTSYFFVILKKYIIFAKRNV